jgi:hypothetical protein
MGKHGTNVMKTFAGLLVLGALLTVDARAQAINRLASKFHFNTEISTTVAPSAGGGGGTPFFSKTVYVPASLSQTPVLFVTISGTGDGHGGSAHAFSCNVDGALCNSGSSSALSLTGWVALQKHNATDDLHDNNINYKWCAITTPGAHTVNLKMASSIGGNSVFIETTHIFIDVAAPSGVDACTAF